MPHNVIETVHIVHYGNGIFCLSVDFVFIFSTFILLCFIFPFFLDGGFKAQGS